MFRVSNLSSGPIGIWTRDTAGHLQALTKWAALTVMFNAYYLLVLNGVAAVLIMTLIYEKVPGGNRTHDIRIKSPTLYQLSYEDILV